MSRAYERWLYTSLLAGFILLLIICPVSWRPWSNLALAQAPLPGARIAENAKPITRAVVPFSMLPSNHMLVRAMINGKGPYRLIFDLGAPITLLSNQVSEATGVVKADNHRSFLFSMRGEAEVAKLQVGNLTVEKLPVIVFDHPALKVLSQTFGRSIDGIIGFTFFARYRTTIDYQVNEMTFEPVAFQIRDLLKELPDRLAGPKTPRRRVLGARGLWGLELSSPREEMNPRGVLIRHVFPGSAAAASGLKPGDVITSLDGRWTVSIIDVYKAAAEVEPGIDVPIIILRDQKEYVLNVHPTDGI
jgi:hypothetical protein